MKFICKLGLLCCNCVIGLLFWGCIYCVYNGIFLIIIIDVDKNVVLFFDEDLEGFKVL